MKIFICSKYGAEECPLYDENRNNCKLNFEVKGTEKFGETFFAWAEDLDLSTVSTDCQLQKIVCVGKDIVPVVMEYNNANELGAPYHGGSKLHSVECLGEAPKKSPQRSTH